MLAPHLAPRLVGKAYVTLAELNRIYPAHFAPKLAAALRKLGWRSVTGRARPGRTGCYWIPPELPQSPQRALWERIRAQLTGGERGRRRPCVPVDGPDIGPELPTGSDVCPRMVVIPPGSFQMGSPPSDKGRDDDEGPVLRCVTMTAPDANLRIRSAGENTCFATR
jgi:hypothetical protein